MADKETTDLFIDLDWATLEAWAGAKTLLRGKEYQRNRRVSSLVRSHDGTLVARVAGSELYVTAVTNRDGLVSACTCPVGVSCKHAVAVILEYIALREKGVPVPPLAPADPRIALLGLRSGIMPAQYRDVTCKGLQVPGSPLPDTGPGDSRRAAGPLRQYLQAMKKKELLELIEELIEWFPEVEQEIADRKSVAEEDPRPVFEALLADIGTITEEEAWSDDWSDNSQIPDYSPVRKRMEMLLAMDQADMVVEAGRVLIRQGMEQLEKGDDRTGEVSYEIASCLDLVFAALRRSGHPVFERLLFAIHAILDDDFDLCADARAFIDEEWPAADWSRVADSLLSELGTYQIPPGSQDYAALNRRDSFTSWIGNALDRAGREDEATALYIDETAVTGDYLRLVRRLRAAGQNDEAAAWIRRGIAALKRSYPGTAGSLKDIQREIWEEEGNYPAVAGLRAEEFVCSPSYLSFSRLMAAAEHAGARDTVKDMIMHYLVSGGSHAVMEEGGDGRWRIFKVLPASGFLDQGSWNVRPGPCYSILIEKALTDQRPEEAVMWFDRCRNDTTRQLGSDYPEDKLWDAVAERFPDRALRYWMERAEREALTATPKGYERAIIYIKKIRALMDGQGRTGEWAPYMKEMRSTHARKKKFIGMLDVLEKKKIYQAELPD
ncbi:MAG TPA: SWIM zinc finger domain-containing protein [Methanolinea sp.]|nr:SWIM zinc finger domain-containing protein [Methanolinea sp.]